ncbi:MAG: hypothetical protein ACRD0Q_09575 [Acidimicrobiales bacterium]
MAGLLLVVPVVVLGLALPKGSDLAVPLYLVLLAGLGVAGHRAGRAEPAAPLTSGAFAALAVFVALEAVIVAGRLVAGRGLASPVLLGFSALMSASAGMFGGLLSTVRRRSLPPAPPRASGSPADDEGDGS